jgi:hypothetical protein
MHFMCCGAEWQVVYFCWLVECFPPKNLMYNKHAGLPFERRLILTELIYCTKGRHNSRFLQTLFSRIKHSYTFISNFKPPVNYQGIHCHTVHTSSTTSVICTEIVLKYQCTTFLYIPIKGLDLKTAMCAYMQCTQLFWSHEDPNCCPSALCMRAMNMCSEAKRLSEGLGSPPCSSFSSSSSYASLSTSPWPMRRFMWWRSDASWFWFRPDPSAWYSLLKAGLLSPQKVVGIRPAFTASYRHPWTIGCTTCNSQNQGHNRPQVREGSDETRAWWQDCLQSVRENVSALFQHERQDKWLTQGVHKQLLNQLHTSQGKSHGHQTDSPGGSSSLGSCQWSMHIQGTWLEVHNR